MFLMFPETVDVILIRQDAAEAHKSVIPISSNEMYGVAPSRVER
jgi:hypothetical protein